MRDKLYGKTLIFCQALSSEDDSPFLFIALIKTGG